MERSEFAIWFERQHGRRDRQGGHTDKRTDEELSRLIIAGGGARDELNRRKLWDARRESALYAWRSLEPPAPRARPYRTRH
jgi:hypothetical protein